MATERLPSRATSQKKEDHDAILRLLAVGLVPLLDDIANDRLFDWLVAHRLRLRDSIRRAAAADWTKLAAEQDWPAAKRAAEVLFQLAPTDEIGLQRLLRARAMCGGVHEAEATYQSFRDTMEATGKEWSPSESTLKLLDRLRSVEQLIPHPPTSPARGSEPPLTGREEVVARLLAAARAPFPKHLDTVLVVGEAGMGKTRLLREVMTGAHLDGSQVLWGASSELEREIALNPLLDAFASEAVGIFVSTLDEPWRSVLVALLPHLHQGPGPVPEPPDVRPGAVPRRLFEAIFVLLQALSASGPVILLLDDVQWVDDTSAAVIAYLRRRWQHGPLRLIIAVRPEVLPVRGTARKLMEDLFCRSEVTTIALDELAPEAADRLARAVATRDLSAEELKHIGSLATRNPFFLIELTLELVSGRLKEAPYTLDGFVSLPPSVMQVFDDRLSTLSPSAERCASLLAVCEVPMAIHQLARLARLSRVRCVEALAELDDGRLIAWTGSRVEIRHAIIRQAVHAKLSVARRLWMHGRIAKSLAATEPRPVDLLAVHYHRAGMREDAFHFATLAGERAEQSGAVAEALRFYMMAQVHAVKDVEATHVLGRIAHLRYLYREFDEAGSLLTEAARRFRELGMTSSFLKASIRGLDSLAQGQTTLSAVELLPPLRALEREALDGGHFEEVARAMDVELHLWDRSENEDEVVALLERAGKLLCLTSDPAARSALNRILALHLYYGNTGRALASARTAITEARKTSGKDALLNSLNRLIVVLLHVGSLDTREGVAALEEAEHLASISGDLFLRYNVRLNYGVWALDIGDLDRAEMAFKRAQELLPPNPDLTHLVLACNVGELHLARGRPEEAERILKKGKEIFRPGMPGYLEDVADAGLGLCALHMGRLREAQEIEARMPPPPHRWCFDPSLIVSFRGQLMARLGRGREALALLTGASHDVSGRLVTSWLKVRCEHHRIARTLGILSEVEVLETLKVAEDLGLKIRRSQLLRLRESVS